MKKNMTPPKVLANRIFRNEWEHLLKHERQAIENVLLRIKAQVLNGIVCDSWREK